MNERTIIGTIFEQPGFRGEVVGFVSGLMVIDGRLQGKLPAHASETDEFVVVVEGELTVTIDGEQSTLTAGSSIIVAAGTRHEVEAPGLLIG